jgi:hypothetical protein
MERKSSLRSDFAALRPTAPHLRLRRYAAWGFRSSRAPLSFFSSISQLETLVLVYCLHLGKCESPFWIKGRIGLKTMARKQIPPTIQDAVVSSSRRRCCICFGLQRDDSEKTHGQIAHLDRNPDNNDFDNLAWLCLDHHAQYDTTSRQAKGLRIGEVKKYRAELYARFARWSQEVNSEHLLNFLASRVTDEDIADAVVKEASRAYFYGPKHAIDVLTMSEFRSDMADTILNHLMVLRRCASWGLLTFTIEEVDDSDDEWPNNQPHTLIRVDHGPTCERLVRIIKAWIDEGRYRAQTS